MAKRIKEWRAKRGLSQRALGDEPGVSREYIARIELVRISVIVTNQIAAS